MGNPGPSGQIRLRIDRSHHHVHGCLRIRAGSGLRTDLGGFPLRVQVQQGQHDPPRDAVPEYPSNVDRPRQDCAFLDAAGKGTLVLELQGYLFFGTATRLIESVVERVTDPELPALRFLLLDFRGVTGIDSSAVMSFEKLDRLAEQARFTAVLTSVSEQVRRPLAHLITAASSAFRTFPDLDHGLGWCEEQLLAGRSDPAGIASSTLQAALVAMVPECVDPEALEASFEAPRVGREPIDRDGRTVRRSPLSRKRHRDSPDRTSRADPPPPAHHAGGYGGRRDRPLHRHEQHGLGGRRNRLRGEVLSPDSFVRIAEQDPVAAAALHLFVARILAERVAADNRTIEALRR